MSKVENSKKADKYPLKTEIQNKQRAFWNILKSKGLITEEKYNRLIRKNALTNEELTSFIERQIVFTGQSTKAVANILSKLMKESEIVYTKAENISDFRKEIDFVKVREINDLHHAHDAYLAIVVGNIYHLKFTKNVYKFVASAKEEYNLGKMYEKDIKRNGKKIWIADIKDENGKVIKEGTKKIVKDMLSKGGILFTRYSYVGKGMLSDQNLINKGKIKKGTKYLPIKSNKNEYLPIEKYGGYNSIKIAFFAYVESEGKKGKKIRTLEGIPVYIVKNSKDEYEDIKKYIKESDNLNNPIILIPKIKKDSFFEIDGYPLHISAKSGEKQITMKSAVQLKINYKTIKYIKQVIKYADNGSLDLNIEKKLEITKEKNLKLYSELSNKMIEGIYSKRPAISSVIKIILNGKEKFENLSIYEQSEQIKKILRLFNTTSESVKLNAIGGSSTGNGELKISKEISKVNKAVLINQSPTGLFERRIDLLQDTEKFFK